VTDIGVYTKKETLEEKKKFTADEGCWAHWSLHKEPGEWPERIFFAADGKWQGFFTIDDINDDFGNFDHYMIFLEEWHELEEKPERKPFQGFTYDVPEAVQ